MALFDPALLMEVTLPEGLCVRPLKKEDYERGYLQLLQQLTTVGDISKEEFERTFDHLRDTYVVVVDDCKTHTVVGTATLLVEGKFIHQCGKVGHIEDVVVDARYRGRNYGAMLLEQLKHIAFLRGCYKLILDCSSHNQPFYIKCGFRPKDVHMVLYR